MATKVITKESCGIASLDITQPSEKQKENMKHVVAKVTIRFALQGTHTELIKQDGKDVAIEVPNVLTVRGIKIVKGTKPENLGVLSVIMPNFSNEIKGEDSEGTVEEEQGGRRYRNFYPTDRLNAEQEAYVLDQYQKLAAIWETQNSIPDQVTIEIPETQAEPVEA